MRLLTNLLANIILVLSILILLTLLVLPLYFQHKAAVVLSGSMEPAMQIGALAFTIDIEPEKVKVGDIIAFRLSEDSLFTTSHRVIEVMSMDSGLFFRTKGDLTQRNMDDAGLLNAKVDLTRFQFLDRFCDIEGDRSGFRIRH